MAEQSRRLEDAATGSSMFGAGVMPGLPPLYGTGSLGSPDSGMKQYF